MPVDCGAARAALHGHAARLERHSRRAIVDRARTLARLSRAPAHHVARHRARLHQQLRELRASARRARSPTASAPPRAAPRAARAQGAAPPSRAARAASELRAPRRRALAAHDPQRTLERGYALVEGAGRRAGDERRRRPPPRPSSASACTTARCGSVPAAPVPSEDARCTYETAHAPDRVDHRPAGLRRGRPARDARAAARRARASSSSAPRELDAVGQGLEELRLDELVTRLEAGATR